MECRPWRAAAPETRCLMEHAGTWEEFGLSAANTAAQCLLAVILGAIARKELLRLSAYVRRRAPSLLTWRGLARAVAGLWE